MHIFVLEAEVNNDVVYSIGECNSYGSELVMNFSVSCILYSVRHYNECHSIQVTALQPLCTHKFALLLNTSPEESYVINDDGNRSITLTAEDVVSIKFTLYDWMYTNEIFIVIAINNECGRTESAAIKLNSTLSKSAHVKRIILITEQIN